MVQQIKKPLSLVVLVIIAVMVNANSVKAQSNFGIRAGLNFANIATDADNNVESRTGFMAGVFYQYQFKNSNFAIQPELLYTQKGFTAETSAQGQAVDATYKLGYIQVPVLFGYNFATSSSVTPHIYVGPYLAFVVTEEVEAEVSGQSASVETDFAKSTDFGATFGVGIGFDSFEIGVRYNLGLTNISDQGGDAKNRVFTITAGYSF